MTPTTKAAAPGTKDVLPAAGGAGKSTIAMLKAKTAIFRKFEIDVFDGDPANPTSRRCFTLMPPKKP